MDPVIQQVPIEILGHLEKDELREFIRLLEKARSRSAQPPMQLSCAGNRCSNAEAAAGQP